MDVRNSAIDGHYEDVLASLDKIPPPALANEMVKQDVDFYRALASARLAASGTGDATKAGSALVAFINANRNSYHFYEANEAVGDLLVTIGRYDQATPFYNTLATAPWPDYKMRRGGAGPRFAIARQTRRSLAAIRNRAGHRCQRQSRRHATVGRADRQSQKPGRAGPRQRRRGLVDRSPRSNPAGK